MLSRRVSTEFVIFLSLLLAGLLFGNIVLIVLSLVPFFFLVLGVEVRQPWRLGTSLPEQKRLAIVNEVVEVTSEFNVGEGTGMVTCHEQLPRHFQLVEGSNFHVFFKEDGAVQRSFSYKVKCTKRGVYQIGAHTLESYNALGLEEMMVVRFDKSTDLLVIHRSIDPRRMRDPRLTSRIPLPITSISRIGPLTTDFKEIREYRPGDMFKSINWKATARLSNGQKLMVNEYEREGRKTVWILLDCGPGMAQGTNVQNAFEYAVQAASGLADYYLGRNCSVGMVLFNKDKVIYPDLGRRQRELIGRTLMRMEMSFMDGGLRYLVRSLKGHLQGTSPLFIVITNVRDRNVDDIKNGMRDLKRYSGPRATSIVIHVSGNHLGAEGPLDDLASVMANMNDLPELKELRKEGTFVVPWDPQRQNLQRMLLFGVGRRG
ncbi:MAG: hypothetical protein A4E32_01174 [Methanomassiliicoccales archaeon PtaU1.Bin124]|nr:MAG: hypothetical protein A4E32_01174 [Methanomassiliicoccales archaeon PtaU1.Bin124]